MIINKDVVAIDDSFNHYARICKEIGLTEEQIEDCRADIYLDNLQGIGFLPLKYSLARLKHHRAELENDKQRAEADIYKCFEHYYS